MIAFMCRACGTQFEPSTEPPGVCPICRDERQFVPPTGQAWTTLPGLIADHMLTVKHEAGVLGIGCSPSFAIGQRALLVRAASGNILWDCISFLDTATVELLQALGGIAAIAISHPHFYTTMLEWSRAFGGIPIYLHAVDRQWVMRSGPEIVFWDGETKTVAPGVTLIRVGGHFDGSTVMHVGDGDGALFSGDMPQVLPDGRHVAFHAKLS